MVSTQTVENWGCQRLQLSWNELNSADFQELIQHEGLWIVSLGESQTLWWAALGDPQLGSPHHSQRGTWEEQSSQPPAPPNWGPSLNNLPKPWARATSCTTPTFPATETSGDNKGSFCMCMCVRVTVHSGCVTSQLFQQEFSVLSLGAGSGEEAAGIMSGQEGGKNSPRSCPGDRWGREDFQHRQKEGKTFRELKATAAGNGPQPQVAFRNLAKSAELLRLRWW